MEEKTLLNAALVFLVTPTEVGLGLKKQKIGAGLLNTVGGGIEPGETAAECAVREAQEEWTITIDPSSLSKVAVADFHNRKSDGELFNCRVHTFFCTTWEGTPQESDEMGPLEWFARDQVPFDRLMLADRDWLPAILSGKYIYAESWYGPKQQTLEQPTILTEVTPEKLISL